MPVFPEISIVQANVLKEPVDLLIMKYSGGLFGAAADVAAALTLDPNTTHLEPGEYLQFEGGEKVAAGRVAFLGTATLTGFRYAEIREFSQRAVELSVSQSEGPVTVGMTMHGIGCRLDEQEAFAAQVAGMLDYFAGNPEQTETAQVRIIEYDPNRYERLVQYLEKLRVEFRLRYLDEPPAPSVNWEASPVRGDPFGSGLDGATGSSIGGDSDESGFGANASEEGFFTEPMNAPVDVDDGEWLATPALSITSGTDNQRFIGANRPENPSGSRSSDHSLLDAGAASEAKPHVFVALPYTDEMEDVYEFGIRQPVNDLGLLCERCDRDFFTGDVIDRIKTRISDASLVIADVTGANPNVYLEIGFAWGCNIPTLLVAREGEELKFDIRGHKCVYYRNINQLRQQVLEMSRVLIVESGVQATP